MRSRTGRWWTATRPTNTRGKSSSWRSCDLFSSPTCPRVTVPLMSTDRSGTESPRWCRISQWRWGRVEGVDGCSGKCIVSHTMGESCGCSSHAGPREAQLKLLLTVRRIDSEKTPQKKRGSTHSKQTTCKQLAASYLTRDSE
jgi:hypothetical protein